MSTVTEATGLGSYLEAFSQVQQRTIHQPEWLRSLREDAFGEFCDMGFPTPKSEAWRFTNVAPMSRETFVLAEAGPVELSLEDLKPFLLSAAACRLVFVNGRFAPALSDCALLPNGLKAGSLAEEIDRDPSTLESSLGRHLALRPDPFCALNTAFLEDGGYVHIARGTVLTAPIHLLFVSTDSDKPLMAHPRNLLIAERDAQADILEEHVSLGDSKFFSNVATELVAAENAVVAHHVIESENRNSFHISTLQIQQERNANVSSHSVLIGGALVRNNVHPVLAGEGSECLINGLFLGEDSQHLDNYMLVEHASPHCNSHQYYNGILGGKSHGVFHGRIIVQKDAQKTDAKQTNRNLLLSDDAQIDTKPQLEIYADDVKCTHGATIGQIDEKALYYLRSRGLDEATARELLLFAFAGECTGRIRSTPIREHVERIVRQSLPEGISDPGTGSGVERRWEEIG
ncbi:MAG TPA: Fe-S cluster assembly protein SufD [Candidatus Angelobacter sp.]|nr:Fe-S cluster assembly protein SufD [Candidatus Angelobacter sp.]